MINQSKTSLLFAFLFFLILSITLLSVSLPQLSFSAGKQAGTSGISRQIASSSLTNDNHKPIKDSKEKYLADLLLRFGFPALLITIFVLSGFFRKRVILVLALIIAVFLVLDLCNYTLPAKQPAPPAELSVFQDAIPTPAAGNAAFAEPVLTQWMVIAASFSLALILILVIWYAQSKLLEPKTAANAIREKAAISASNIQTGEELNNIIHRCYTDMHKIVRESKGYQREDTMTAREFESLLVKMGFSQAPVQHLTRLFEQIRYGNFTPTTEDENDAVNCLLAIANSTGKEP